MLYTQGHALTAAGVCSLSRAGHTDPGPLSGPDMTNIWLFLMCLCEYALKSLEQVVSKGTGWLAPYNSQLSGEEEVKGITGLVSMIKYL